MNENGAAAMNDPTTTARKSDRELVVTRTFNAPPHIVFAAWTKPELLMKWWAPKSFGLSFVACETDVRVGGKCRFVFNVPNAPKPMEFFGTYLDVVPNARLVWTNEEGGEGSGPVTTVTFDEKDGTTVLVMRDLFPSKEALDEAIASGSTSGTGETFRQLDALLGVGSL